MIEVAQRSSRVELARDQREVPAPAISVGEIWFAGLVGSLLLGLHCIYAMRMKYNSDEPQHLHVVWGWANGLLQYRDVFDNHAPLFHLMMSPILRVVGERPDALIPMRFTMFPLWLASVAAVYQIFARSYNPRIGLWSALFAAASPAFFLKMTEFRTDVLWTALWLIGLAWLVSGPATKRRFFFAGLTFGAAISVSMKTSLLLASVGSAALVLWVLQKRDDKLRILREYLPLLGVFLLGFVVIPSILLTYFASQGAWAALRYCVIEHNKMPEMNLWHRARYHVRLLGFGGAAVVALGYWLVNRTPGRAGVARAFVVLVTGFYYLAFEGIWPIVSAQDYMPFDPLFAGCLAPAAIWLGDFAAMRFSWRPLAFVPAAAMLLVAVLRMGVGFEKPEFLAHFAIENPWKDGTSITAQRIADVLNLTRPGELVMDGKGESVFRPRTYYYVLELLTHQRIEKGLLKDDIVERLIATRTAVMFEPRLPDRDLAFADANYLSIGGISVLGQHLAAPVDGAIQFEVRIPETYSLISGKNDVAGTLDGTPMTGPRFLDAGPHEFRPLNPKPKHPIDLFLGRAHEKGYVPIVAEYANGNH